MQWNINGLTAHIEKLKLLLNELPVSIICIQETNYKDNFHYSLSGYQCAYKNRIDRERASGGVAIYVKNDFEFEEIPVVSDIEVVATRIWYYQRRISVVNIYIYLQTKISNRQTYKQ